MSWGTSNRDGGKTSESGHLRIISKIITGNVVTGLGVVQRAAGANMSVDIGIGDGIVMRSDGVYGHQVFNDAVENKTVTTADGSNPRRDIVVAYIDYGETPSTLISNNTNGVVKSIIVAGTPAGSPTDPSDAAIQSAVGSGNPWFKLARVRVPAAQTSISNSLIDDLRSMATGLMQGGWVFDDVNPWAYASASTFTVAGVDVTSQFPKGTKLALYQSGAIKYFTVVSSTFSTNTTVTVNGQGTYTLANVPIDKPAYSYHLVPQGFPTNEASVPFYNPYKFSAYYNGSTSITNQTLKIPFNTENFDTNNNFDPTTNNRYTAPVDGFYFINTQGWFGVAGAGSNEAATVFIYKNGSAIRDSEKSNGSGTGDKLPRPSVTAFLQLTAGDYIEVYMNAVGSRNIQGGSADTFLEGYLVSRT